MTGRTSEFQPGDRVVHPSFGIGVVIRCEGAERVEVEFDRSGKKMLALEYANLRLATDRDEAAGVAAFNDWRLRQIQAFEQEGDGTEHFMGSHWDPFFEDREVFDRLPSVLAESHLLDGFASNDRYQPPYPPAFDWPTGFYLSWPRRQEGLALAVKVGETENTIVSIYPFVGHGTEHSIEINKVHVWESGLEAQIEATLKDAQITFFDPLFAINRGWYAAGDQYQFVMAGIAYSCRLARDRPFTIKHPPEVLALLQERAREQGGDMPEPEETVHTKGMAMFLPIEAWDRDDYRFHGPVKSVKPMEMLGQEAWMVRAAILRTLKDDQDIDLDIVVTRRVWGGGGAPEVGQDVEGTLWLQGYLWYPHRWRR